MSMFDFLNKKQNEEKPVSTVHGDLISPTHTEQSDIVITTDISEEMYDRLSEQYHVTQSALNSLFKILEQNQVPLGDLDSTLRKIADQYNELLAKVDTLKSNDEAVKLLINNAKQAIENGEFDTAESLFNQVKKQSIDSAKKRLTLVKEQQAIAEQELLLAAESAYANGELKKTQLSYKEAGEYYREAAELLPTGDDETLARYLNKAGKTFYYAGFYYKAKPLFEQSLAIRERVLDKEHPDVAESLNNLALLHQDLGNYEQAKPLLEGALAIDEKVYGTEHPDVAIDLNNLAVLHYSQGNYEQAKPLYDRALAIWEKVYGIEHPQVALGLNNLAGLLKSQRNYAQAKPLLERAIAIAKKIFGEEDSNTCILIDNYNDLIEKMMRKKVNVVKKKRVKIAKTAGKRKRRR